jgi:hypothetical protein
MLHTVGRRVSSSSNVLVTGFAYPSSHVASRRRSRAPRGVFSVERTILSTSLWVRTLLLE